MPYHKFIHTSSNQVGYVLYALALYACMQLARTRGRRRYHLTLLGLATTGAGLLYSFSWLVICACVLATTMVALGSRDRKWRSTSIHAIITVILASAVALPYILLISSGRSAESSLKILPGLATMLRSLGVLLVAVAPVGVLAAVYRKRMVAEFHEHPGMMTLLLVWFAVPCTLSIVTFVPGNCQYKFLGHALLSLGLLTAAVLETLYRSRKIAAVAYIFLLSIGMVWDHATVFRTSWPAIDPVYGDGMYLRHRDDNEDALYTWIATNTTADAVFLDTQLTVPVLGRRSLYVAVDWRKDGLLKANPGLSVVVDGWGLDTSHHVLGIAGHARAQVEQRLALADALLSPTGESVNTQVLAQLREEVSGRPVYVIARDTSLRSRMSRDRRMSLSYEGTNASVFLVAQETSAAGAAL